MDLSYNDPTMMSSETHNLSNPGDIPDVDERTRSEDISDTSVHTRVLTTASEDTATDALPIAASPITVRRVLRWLLVLGTLSGVGWFLWSAWAVLLPFQIGLILAYMVLPLVNWFEQYMPRWTAILVVYLGGLILLVGFFAYIVPPLVSQATNFIREFPSLEVLETRASNLLEQYQSTVPATVQEPVNAGISQAIDQLQSNLTTYVQEGGTFLLTSVLQVVNTVTFLFGFVIIPFWLFYVLKDERQGRMALNRMLPERICADFWAVSTIINRIFSSYIRGQLLLGVIVGAFAGVGLSILSLFGLSVDSILILAIIAGITEFIPIIGPVIGAIPAIILGFIDSPTTGFAVIILYIGIQQIENNLLVPRIVGESVGIHPAILMVVLVVLSQSFGLLGIILSAPLTAVVRDMFVYTYGRLSDPPRPAGVLPKRSNMNDNP